MFDYHILIITFILILICLIICHFNKKNKDVGVGILILAVLFWLIGGFICEASKPLQFDRSIPIVSLETQNAIEGNFVLGCGYVREKPVYYFYIKNKDGNYELWNSSSICGYDFPHTELKLTDKEDPKIELYENTFFSKIILVVPTNTIRQNFNGNIK